MAGVCNDFEIQQRRTKRLVSVFGDTAERLSSLPNLQPKREEAGVLSGQLSRPPPAQSREFPKMNATPNKAASAAAQTRASSEDEIFKINIKRRMRGCKVPLRAVTRNAALAAAIETMAAASEVADPLADAHTATEDALAALTPEAPAKQAAEAHNAERKAEARWKRAYRAAERAGQAILRVEVDTAEDAVLQGKAYAWCFERHGVADLMEDDLRLPLASATRALKALARQPSPPPPPVQPAPEDPTVTAYQAARRQQAEYGHGLDPSGGLGDEYDVDECPAADDMLRTPPANVAGIAVRLGRIVSEAFIHRAGEWDCPVCAPGCREDVSAPTHSELCGAAEGHNGGADALFRALAFLHLGAERLAQAEPPKPASDAQAAWDAALASWADARAIYDAHEEASMATWRALAEAAPAEIVETSLHQRLAVRWTAPVDLERDILLSEAEKDALRPLLIEHYARQKEHYEAPERTEEDRASRELYDRVIEVENKLLATAPPTIQALVFKQQLEAREADDDKLGYDDLGNVAYLLGSYREKRDPVILHMDLLRMAGVYHPMLDIEPFRPRDWIKAYEAAGGFVSAATHDDLLLFPAAEATDELQRQLDAAWKYRAVRLEAQNQREQGGDPIFDAYGRTGRNDNRGGKPKGPSHPYLRVERVTFGQRDGAITARVQSLHRQGDRLVERTADQAQRVAA